MRTCAFLLVAVTAMICAIGTPATGCGETPYGTPIENGWKPIPDINDRHIQELGDWAVLEFFKHANCILGFNKVVSGKEEIVSGMNYALVIIASDVSGEPSRYNVEVYEQEWTKTRKLISFNKAK